MSPLDIIKKYYHPESPIYKILVSHSMTVANKAQKIAENFLGQVDLNFIKEASLLHDIGIFLTDAPEIGCHGDKPYICHGYLGREILEKEGFPKHALVCERHVGAGIDIKQIKEKNLPLPVRNMIPQTLEEEIIAYADKFYSKEAEYNNHEKSIETIISSIKKYSPDEAERFKIWHKKFNI